jgi:type VI secretion system secreted protein Hcp
VAFDIFLKLVSGVGSPDVLGGESLNQKHANEIDVHSFSWGESRDGTTADPQELAFVTPVSIASPHLAKFCAEGTPIQSAQLSVNTSNLKSPTELLMIKLTGVTVGSYQLGVADTDPEPTDRFTLAFSTIDITKRGQGANGSPASSNATIIFPPPAT